MNIGIVDVSIVYLMRMLGLSGGRVVGVRDNLDEGILRLAIQHDKMPPSNGVKLPVVHLIETVCEHGAAIESTIEAW